VAQLGYTRDAEAEADAFARQRLAQARISSAGGAAFFERERKKTGDEPAWASWFESHPASLERERAFRDAVNKNGSYIPALSDEEFAAIRGMCRQDKTVKNFDLF
jgi:predicted Zn-dependent protease